MNEKIIIKN